MGYLRLALLLVALVGCSGQSTEQAMQRDSAPIDSSPMDPPRADDEAYLVAILELSDSTIPGHAQAGLVFANGDTLVIPARDVRLHRWFLNETAGPWLVVFGVRCSECDASEGVYFLKARPGVLPRDYSAYTYPGELIEIEGNPDQRPHFRSRMFIGTCLADAGPGGVIVEEQLETDVAVKQRVVRVITVADVPLESQRVWSELIERQVADAVSRGECHELSGVRQYLL